MTYQPIVPLGGYTGWRFLSRTMESQKDAFVNSAPVKRDLDYFRETIKGVQTVDDLMGDRRLLRVALGAFGLDNDLTSGAFIRKVLAEGTEDGSLAHKLSDKRYATMSEAFGFAQSYGPNTRLNSFADDVLSRYQDRQFEQAVGQSNGDMRLALNVEPGLADVVEQSETLRGQWFSIMGNAPLRQVFEKALGFPSSFGRIDIDQQQEAFRDRAKSVFGTDDPRDFLEDGALRETLIRLFTVRSEAESFSAATNSGTIALTLLQSAPRLY